MNSKAVLSGYQSALGFAALYMAHLSLQPLGLSCLCPPLGAVAVLLFCAPQAAASQPTAIICGHIIAGIVGYGVVTTGVPFAEAIASVLTITLMAQFGVVHPPAAAYAYLYAVKRMGPKGIIAPGLIGAIILIAVQKATSFVISTDQKKETNKETKKDTKKDK
eukprot:280370_1